MPPARMWRDKSNLGRLRRAGLAYTEDEVLANPDLRGLEAYVAGRGVGAARVWVGRDRRCRWLTGRTGLAGALGIVHTGTNCAWWMR